MSDGKMHEVNVLDLMTPEPGSFTIMDRGFLDFARLYRLTQAGAFFVIFIRSGWMVMRWIISCIIRFCSSGKSSSHNAWNSSNQHDADLRYGWVSVRIMLIDLPTTNSKLDMQMGAGHDCRVVALNGYESSTIDDFVATLKSMGIERIAASTI